MLRYFEGGDMLAMKLALPAAAGFLALAAVPASAQVLWQNVSVGMSANEIQKLQPKAIVPGEKPTLKSGWATCELSIQSYEVGSYQFSVCFYMREGRLVQVTLKGREPSAVVFRSIADLLRTKYGRELNPAAEPCRDIGSMRVCEMNWLLPSGVNVNALYMDIGGKGPLLNINYQTRLKEDSGRL